MHRIKQTLDHIYESDEFDFSFLEDDPVQIPRSYTKLQNVEIVAFWVAMLAWGQRTTIINKSKELFALMGNDPHAFVLNLTDADRKLFTDFKHRTFCYTDTLYFLDFFHWYYNEYESLEDAFLLPDGTFDAKQSLTQYHDKFFSLPFAPDRTRKHVATPVRKSACKRINLFLKWMVRNDEKSGDMGVWHRIPQSELIIPVDVHVMKSCVQLGIAKEQQVNWKLAESITDYLRKLDPTDPVKYDYSLFVYSRYADKLV